MVDKMSNDCYKSEPIMSIAQTPSKIGLFSDSIETSKKILVELDRYLAKIIYNMIKSGILIILKNNYGIFIIFLLHILRLEYCFPVIKTKEKIYQNLLLI